MDALDDEMPLARAEAAGERRSASPEFMAEEHPPRDEQLALQTDGPGSGGVIDLTESADMEGAEDSDAEEGLSAGQKAGSDSAGNPASQKSAKRRAADTDTAPSEDAGDGPSASGVSASASDSVAPATKKRRYAAVKKSEKCGKCDNCLNPHWKKPCIEARKSQEAAPAAGPAKKPAPVAATIDAASISNTKPSAASSAAFVESLGKIMAPGAGIMHPHHVPVFIDLMKRASNWAQRTSLLHALVRSPSDVQSEMIYQKGLLILQKWLGEAIEAKRSTSLQNLLNALDALPMTLAALQPPCELGRMVGKLKKAAGMDESIQNHAKNLVVKWKAVVAQGDAGSLAQPAAVAAAAAAKASSAAAETKAAVAKAATSTTTTSEAKVVVKKTPSASSGLSLGDGDIFGAADKKRADAAVAREKHQQTTDGPTSSTTSSASATAASAGTKPLAGGAAKKPASEPTTPSRSTSFSLLSATSSKISAPPPMLTGADRARQRAKDAAARVPSPPPGPRKEKRKKVSWVNGNELEAVRWFRRTDPPAAAQKDVDDSVAEAVAEPPPRFASAAKKEHLSEAVALKQHREQEEHEEAEFVERLSHMKVDIQWYDPPIIAAAENAALQVAKGEHSEEAMNAARRRAAHLMPPVIYPTRESIPYSPAEPLDPADRGASAGGHRQPFNVMHRIPLSLEESRAWQHAPPPQLQQSPPGGYYHQPQQPPAHQPMYSQHRPPPAAPHHAPAYPGMSAPTPYGAAGGVPGYGAPPPVAAPPIPMTSATAAAPPLGGGLPALPDGLGAALSQLAASGALNNLADPPQQQQYQVPGEGEPQERPPRYKQRGGDEKRKEWMRQYMERQKLKQEREKLQQIQQKQQKPQQKPPQQQHQGPRLPPGLRPMLGLHGRPQQQQPQQAQQQQPMYSQGPPQQQQQQGGGGGGFLKTVPCKFFNSPIGCKHGDRCKFSHALSANNAPQ